MAQEQGGGLQIRGSGGPLVSDAIDQDVVVPDGPSTLDESRGLASSHSALREEALWGVLGRDSLQIPYIGLWSGIEGL